MVFFLADDANAAGIVDMSRVLSGGPAQTSEGDTFLRYYRSLMDSFDARRPEVQEFDQTLHRFLATVLVEKTTAKELWTLEDFLAIRKIVVGIPAFSDCWRALRGISFSDQTRRAVHESSILDITCELAGLVNDIASFDRDADAVRAGDPNADPNLVVFMMRQRSREAALEHAIRWYNHKVEEFHRIEQTLLAGPCGRDQTLRDYVEVLHRAIVGDLATSKHLGPLRYEGSRHSLDRLLMLDSLVAP